MKYYELHNQMNFNFTHVKLTRQEVLTLWKYVRFTSMVKSFSFSFVFVIGTEIGISVVIYLFVNALTHIKCNGFFGLIEWMVFYILVKSTTLKYGQAVGEMSEMASLAVRSGNIKRVIFLLYNLDLMSYQKKDLWFPFLNAECM